ncbi:MAG: prepilin-type N-terminal cleavage/methylation domain-containing protein [Candidatus Omnitrophica bacterium]|nr:prepilin-type N-terminal cleavage/methylation domain-containing protein [Candidatus Omnitrophota bacterium]MCF7894052.1 prepilin-type N-terminal cleavage/methylation domain-containing protein [Candidatus Omnitrophota bacterium]
MKSRKNFTLIELLIVVIILGTVATFAIPAYRNVVENSKAKVCRTNLKLLIGGVKSYALENDKLPGSLGQLRDRHLDRAWAQILEKEDRWKIDLAYLIVNIDKGKLAFAQGSWDDMISLTCPADDTPPPQGHSYGINKNIANMSLEDFKKLPEDTIIVADSNNPTFTKVLHRHKHYNLTGASKYGQSATKDKQLRVHGLSSSVKVPGVSRKPSKMNPSGIEQRNGRPVYSPGLGNSPVSPAASNSPIDRTIGNFGSGELSDENPDQGGYGSDVTSSAGFNQLNRPVESTAPAESSSGGHSRPQPSQTAEDDQEAEEEDDDDDCPWYDPFCWFS